MFDLETIEGRNKLVADWLVALRSGKYVQGRGALRRFNRARQRFGFCCLGVLADTVSSDWVEHASYGANAFTPDGYTNFDRLLGDNTTTKRFYGLNDAYRKTFIEIADIIERYWDPETATMKEIPNGIL